MASFKLAGGERLEEIVRRADFHRLDRRLDRAEPGDDDDFHRRVRFLELTEQIHALPSGSWRSEMIRSAGFLLLLFVGLEAGS